MVLGSLRCGKISPDSCEGKSENKAKKTSKKHALYRFRLNSKNSNRKSRKPVKDMFFIIAVR